MKFAAWLFLIAGVYGVLLVTPFFFLERQLGDVFPPEVNHPELYYGFFGAVLAWQVMYLIVASDPPRYRPVMLLAAAAKMGFFLCNAVLWSAERAEGRLALLAAPDALFAILFVVAWAHLRGNRQAPNLD